MHRPTAAKCDRPRTRDLVFVRRHWRTTRRYWYLWNEPQAPFSRMVSVRFDLSGDRTASPVKVDEKRTVTFLGRLSHRQHLRGTCHQPMLDSTNRNRGHFQSSAMLGSCEILGAVEVKGRHLLPRRPSSSMPVLFYLSYRCEHYCRTKYFKYIIIFHLFPWSNDISNETIYIGLMIISRDISYYI